MSTFLHWITFLLVCFVLFLLGIYLFFLTTSQSIFSSTFVYIRLFVSHLSIRLFMSVNIYPQSAYPSIYLSCYPSIRLFLYVCLVIYTFAYLSMLLFICMSVYLPINLILNSHLRNSQNKRQNIKHRYRIHQQRKIHRLTKELNGKEV